MERRRGWLSSKIGDSGSVGGVAGSSEGRWLLLLLLLFFVVVVVLMVVVVVVLVVVDSVVVR